MRDVILIAALLLVAAIVVAVQVYALRRIPTEVKKSVKERDQEHVHAFKQAVRMMADPGPADQLTSEPPESDQRERRRRRGHLRGLPSMSGVAVAAVWVRDHAAVTTAIGSAAVVATFPTVPTESSEPDRPPAPISQPAPPRTAITSIPNTVVTPPASAGPVSATASSEKTTPAPAAPSATTAPSEPPAATALPVPLVSQPPPMPVVAPVVAPVVVPDPAPFAYQPESTTSAQPGPRRVQVDLLGLLSLGPYEASSP